MIPCATLQGAIWMQLQTYMTSYFFPVCASKDFAQSVLASTTTGSNTEIWPFWSSRKPAIPAHATMLSKVSVVSSEGCHMTLTSFSSFDTRGVIYAPCCPVPLAISNTWTAPLVSIPMDFLYLVRILLKAAAIGAEFRSALGFTLLFAIQRFSFSFGLLHPPPLPPLSSPPWSAPSLSPWFPPLPPPLPVAAVETDLLGGGEEFIIDFDDFDFSL
mmetsp:Transcript_8784/g.13818  ORF Transcript_8784/g.13818 Transcript_8784/m.13818 type:complete len:215 (-) Transcript_8784:766-1410(-)